MSKFKDISIALHEKLPVWPGSCGFKLSQTSRIDDGDAANNSKIVSDVHVGTHVDAPWHFVKNGKTVDQINLNRLIGKAYVLHLPGVAYIDRKLLEKQDYPEQVKKLLLRTDNSELWENNIEYFYEDFVALTADAAEFIVELGIELVGIDYLSIQRFHDSPLTHEILLEAEVVILEGVNLTSIDAGEYELICLPLKLPGSDGAPARAVLKKI